MVRSSKVKPAPLFKVGSLRRARPRSAVQMGRYMESSACEGKSSKRERGCKGGGGVYRPGRVRRRRSARFVPQRVSLRTVHVQHGRRPPEEPPTRPKREPVHRDPDPSYTWSRARARRRREC